LSKLMLMKAEVHRKYSGKVRVRACGVLIENNKLLMIKHLGLGTKGYLWIPPGGGVETGSSVEETIEREFLEETGLNVTCRTFLFLNEFINNSLHAIEIFMDVKKTGGELKIGIDPEVSEKQQIIEEVKFLSLEDIKSEGQNKVHSRFCEISSYDELLVSKGFFNFKNIYLK